MTTQLQLHAPGAEGTRVGWADEEVLEAAERCCASRWLVRVEKASSAAAATDCALAPPSTIHLPCPLQMPQSFQDLTVTVIKVMKCAGGRETSRLFISNRTAVAQNLCPPVSIFELCISSSVACERASMR